MGGEDCKCSIGRWSLRGYAESLQDSCDANWTWLFCGGEFFCVSNEGFKTRVTTQILQVVIVGHVRGFEPPQLHRFTQVLECHVAMSRYGFSAREIIPSFAH